MALFPPDMLSPVKQTFVLDKFSTLVAVVVVLKSVLQPRGKHENHAVMLFKASG